MSTKKGADMRKDRRWWSKHHSATYDAYCEGMDAGMDAATRGKPIRNPYPPGTRHDEFDRGANVEAME